MEAMFKSAQFAAVNTKIRAIEGGFLTDEDFKNMLETKSVQELAGYLKSHTRYRNVLFDIDESKIHRAQLEALIKKEYSLSIEKIAHYFRSGYSDFYKYIFVRCEVEDLKSILRRVKNGENVKSENGCFFDFGAHSRINPEGLLESTDIYEFIKRLQSTEYYRYLSPILEIHEKNILFFCMMALDLAYFHLFYKNLREISQEDRRLVEEVQGTHADLLNIQWIYRGLKFYGIAPEILYNYTIPYGHIFDRKGLKNLCYSRDMEEFEKKVRETRYDFLFDASDTLDIFMERRMMRFQYYKMRSLKRRQEMNISQAITYDMLQEFEIRDIISVIESIRYDMPFDEAKKYLIRKL